MCFDSTPLGRHVQVASLGPYVPRLGRPGEAKHLRYTAVSLGTLALRSPQRQQHEQPFPVLAGGEPIAIVSEFPSRDLDLCRLAKGYSTRFIYLFGILAKLYYVGLATLTPSKPMIEEKNSNIIENVGSNLAFAILPAKKINFRLKLGLKRLPVFQFVKKSTALYLIPARLPQRSHSAPWCIDQRPELS